MHAVLLGVHTRAHTSVFVLYVHMVLFVECVCWASFLFPSFLYFLHAASFMNSF